MTQKAKEFAKYLSENPTIANELGAKTEGAEECMDIILQCAKDQGFELTAEDFAPDDGELSKEELATVAGGGDCFCVLGGGGTASNENQPACGCVAYGQGNDTYGMPRCLCFASGTGSAYFPY